MTPASSLPLSHTEGMAVTPRPAAILVLAGGQATRMGGGDKPLIALQGKPLLAHILARIARPGLPILLSANGDLARFAAFGLPVVADALPDYPGPLAGILAGLDWAQAQGLSGDMISVPGDCPFLPADLAERLLAAPSALACAASGGWTHPVIGRWPIALRAPLRAALLAGERKIDRFTAPHGCTAVEWPMGAYDPFFNINTFEDLAQAEKILPVATP